MYMFGKLFNLFHRLQPPVAWTDQTRVVVKHYLRQGRVVHGLTVHSNVNQLSHEETQEHYRNLEDIVAGLQGVPIYLASKYSTETSTADALKKVYQVGESYLEAELLSTNFHPRSIQVDVSGSQASEVERILDTLKPWIREAPPIETTSRVYTMVQTRDGVAIRGIGETKTDLEPGNYAPETVESYNHIVNCLGSADPCGRFCLFDGPPGTGKSYLIRSLINTLDAVFVLVPSTMLGQLSGPALLPTFLNIKAGKKPLILILEDADMALVSREVSRGSPAALAEVLNLGDGLIGEMLNLRIIATTNAERIDLDPAIMRPGRMCTHLTLGELPAPRLASIYDRLSNTDHGLALVRKSHAKTLAEVYQLARDAAWASKAADTGPAGQYL